MPLMKTILSEKQKLHAVKRELKCYLDRWAIDNEQMKKDIEDIISFIDGKQVWETYEDMAKKGYI